MIAEYNIGGYYLSQDNAETFAQAQALNRGLQRILEQHQGLPLLLGVDQEGHGACSWVNPPRGRTI